MQTKTLEDANFIYAAIYSFSSKHAFKGQMNQNLNIFSLAILKRRNVKQNIQKETYAEILLYEP